MGANGLPVYSEGTVGHNWVYMNGTLCLLYGTFDFSSTHPQNTSAGTQTAPPVACPIEIESDAEITGGIFEKAVTNNGGTIYDGTFNTMVENNVVSWGTLGKIVGGAFNGTVTNKGTKATIENGTFNGDVANRGTINNGTFAANKEVTNYGTINNGFFVGNVKNGDTIEKGTIENGIFEDSVINEGTINNGIFEENVRNENEGKIFGGAFSSTVYNYGGTISGGTFAAGLSWNDGSVTGGVFNGDKELTGVTGLHSITWDAASSDAKITEVNGVPAEWDPYVVIERNALPEVTITASTKIYSLNGKRLGTNDRVNGDKKTVKFTMLDENVVLSTGELVIGSDGYPVGSNGGQDFCSGNDWEYSNYKGTLYLSAGTFDLSTQSL